MGSDDLFHKAKKARDLARKAGRRKGKERVLIVCEGAKTEPNYTPLTSEPENPWGI